MPDQQLYALDKLGRNLQSISGDLQSIKLATLEISSDVADIRRDLDTALQLLRSLAKHNEDQ